MPFKRVPRRRKLMRKRVVRPRRTNPLRRPVKTSLPEHMNCRLTYYSGQQGATTTTSPSVYTVYVTDIYDLMGDSTYKQPRYFDQLAALYQRYRVNAVKYEFDFSPLTGSSYVAHGLFPDNFSSTTVGKKTFEEDPRWRIMVSSTNRGPIKVRGYKSIAAIEDIPKRVIRDDDSYNPQVTEPPTRKPSLRIGFQALDEATSYGHWLNGKIVFYCTFFQLKQPSAS